MTTQTIKAILPVKSSSERLENKNFLDFCGKPLYQVILDRLTEMPEISDVYVDTDSQRVIEEISHKPKVRIIKRPTNLEGHHITANTLIEYDLTQIEGTHFLQTHATNPLLSEKTIRGALKAYFANLNEYDSLFTVYPLKKRTYDYLGTPVNCSGEILERTQHLPEVLIENSSLFLFSRESFAKAKGNRIGLKPQRYLMHEVESIDIDFQHEFVLAQLIHENRELFKDWS